VADEAVIVEVGVVRNHCICGLDVRIVIQLPVRSADLARGMEKTSPDRAAEDATANSHSNGTNSLDNSVNDVRRRLKEIRDKKIEKMNHGILATKSHNPKGNMLDHGGGSLSVDLVAVDQGIFLQNS
jgi:hypothetical protein